MSRQIQAWPREIQARTRDGNWRQKSNPWHFQSWISSKWQTPDWNLQTRSKWFHKVSLVSSPLWKTQDWDLQTRSKLFHRNLRNTVRRNGDPTYPRETKSRARKKSLQRRQNSSENQFSAVNREGNFVIKQHTEAYMHCTLFRWSFPPTPSLIYVFTLRFISRWNCVLFHTKIAFSLILLTLSITQKTQKLRTSRSAGAFHRMER